MERRGDRRPTVTCICGKEGLAVPGDEKNFYLPARDIVVHDMYLMKKFPPSSTRFFVCHECAQMNQRLVRFFGLDARTALLVASRGPMEVLSQCAGCYDTKWTIRGVCSTVCASREFGVARANEIHQEALASMPPVVSGDEAVITAYDMAEELFGPRRIALDDRSITIFERSGFSGQNIAIPADVMANLNTTYIVDLSEHLLSIGASFDEAIREGF